MTKTQALAVSQTQELAAPAPNFPMMSAEVAEKVLAYGDLSKLDANQRLELLQAVCDACQVDARTRPFEFLTLQGKTVLYARKDCTDQLRARHGVTTDILSAQKLGEELYVVKVRASVGGRHDEATGVVHIASKKGDDLANALMKCETKAKRRATLSLCGLGFLDESEIEDAQTSNPTITTAEDRAAAVKRLWDVGSRVFQGDKLKMKNWLAARDQNAQTVQKLQPAAIEHLIQQLEQEAQSEPAPAEGQQEMFEPEVAVQGEVAE